MTNLFNSSAFFIVLENCLEASIIFSILFRFIDESENEPNRNITFKNYVWRGVLIALFFSIFFAAIVMVMFFVQKLNLLNQIHSEWDATFKLISCILITALSFKMMKFDRIIVKPKKFMEENIGLNSISGYVFSFLALIVTIRIFFRVSAGLGMLDPSSIAIPCVLGFAIALTANWLINRAVTYLVPRSYFQVSITLLFFIAAGYASGCAQGFEQARYDIKPYNPPDVLWNTSSCCNEEINGFFYILNGIFGYQSLVTITTLVVYFAYWIIVASIYFLLRIFEKRIETDFEMAEDSKLSGIKSRSTLTMAAPPMESRSCAEFVTLPVLESSKLKRIETDVEVADYSKLRGMKSRSTLAMAAQPIQFRSWVAKPESETPKMVILDGFDHVHDLPVFDQKPR